MRLETMLTPEYVEKYRDVWPNKTILDYLRACVDRVPDKVAIEDRKGRYTFRELAAAVDRVALGLMAHGVGPGDVVSFQLPNWNEFVILHFAVTRLGAISNPLIPIYRDREISYMVRMAEAKVLVIPDEFAGFDYPAMVERLRPEWPALETVFVVGDRVPAGMRPFAELLEEPWEQWRDPRVLDDIVIDPNDVTEIVFTSGTTGDPKGVMHTHNSLCTSTEYFVERLKMTPDDVVFMASTFAHQTGFLYGARIQVHVGCTAIYQDVWNPLEFLDAIEHKGVSITMAATPYLYDAVHVEGMEKRDLSAFRAFVTAGAPVPPALVKEAAERLPGSVLAGWGQSENGLVTLTFLNDPEEKLTQTSGYPFPGMELLVVDDEGRPCPAGVEGDLWCRGPAMFVGYLKNIDMTRNQFVGDWFKTGDRAILDEDGYVKLAGRSSDIIRRRGEQVPVTLLEDVLHEHPDIAVAQVVAMPSPDPEEGERGCAFVSLRPGAKPFTIDRMREFLRERGIRQQDWPERLEVVREFPRTPSGKIQKYVLRRMIREKLAAEGVLPAKG
ncbi:AMP-binding protein [Alicyclobacillus macrosporangiidus]|uniref:AMP-binding protein n=1 Tax=Alicyclobacillus macrosporangiidus TaxID=392015 RepID=UPI00049806D9|nr:AMP-binding protein [Alicyclobacillus macrosporangiidus]